MDGKGEKCSKRNPGKSHLMFSADRDIHQACFFGPTTNCSDSSSMSGRTPTNSALMARSGKECRCEQPVGVLRAPGLMKWRLRVLSKSVAFGGGISGSYSNHNTSHALDSRQRHFGSHSNHESQYLSSASQSASRQRQRQSSPHCPLRTAPRAKLTILLQSGYRCRSRAGAVLSAR